MKVSTLLAIALPLVIMFLTMIFLIVFHIVDLEDLTAKHAKGIAALELALAAKIPEPIKFYTIPGYDCDDSEIKGHCTKWNITQAEYDKNFFKVTSN